MTRPRRLYTTTDGKFYYLIDGKKKFVKVPAGVSEKQIARINIKNIVNAGTTKRIKRRRKRIKPAFGAKVGSVLAQSNTGGLPIYFFKPKKNIPTLQDQAEASADTTVDKLAKSILKLLPSSSKIEPSVERPPAPPSLPPPPPAEALPPAEPLPPSPSSRPPSPETVILEDILSDINKIKKIMKKEPKTKLTEDDILAYKTILNKIAQENNFSEDERKRLIQEFGEDPDLVTTYQGTMANAVFGDKQDGAEESKTNPSEVRLPLRTPDTPEKTTTIEDVSNSGKKLGESKARISISKTATPVPSPESTPLREENYDDNDFGYDFGNFVIQAPPVTRNLQPEGFNPLPAISESPEPPKTPITSTTEPEPISSQKLKGVIPPKPKTNNLLPITLERTTERYKEDALETAIEPKKDFQLPKPDLLSPELRNIANSNMSAREKIDKFVAQSIKEKTPAPAPATGVASEGEPDIEGGGYGDGLYNDEIEKIVKKRIKNYVPVIASDEINQLPRYVARGDKRFGFVINTNPSTSDGSGNDGYRTGHWRAVYINNEDDYPTVEYFDPLAEGKMPPELITICRKIAIKMNPSMMFKYKQNMLRRQSKVTSTCGHHAIKFLDDRYNGVPWSDATGYDDYMEKHSSPPDDSHDGEKDISKYIKKYESYI